MGPAFSIKRTRYIIVCEAVYSAKQGNEDKLVEETSCECLNISLMYENRVLKTECSSPLMMT
jgi:hypothetical protein